MQAFALRKKESVQFRPFEHVVPFAETGLPDSQWEADRYVSVKGKGGRVRWVPVTLPARLAALESAQQVVTSRDAHMGAPDRDLKRNLRRLEYVLEKFGITLRERGITGHGLRHEELNDKYEGVAGVPSPVRGGGPVAPALDREARLAVSRLAGHARMRASGAYLGSSAVMRSKARKAPPAGAERGNDDDAPVDV
jgi:integrase